MSDQRTVNRLIALLRRHVADLRRMEREGADPSEVEQRKRLISRLQTRLADTVRDLLSDQRPSPA
jgi:hypothetical protein